MIHKACPVVLHPDGAPLRHLILHHPEAGLQLVKGTVESAERPEHAASRELFEESGCETTSALLLGQSTDIVDGEVWHFVLCRLKPPVRDTWQHVAQDDGGHLFRFSWHPFDTPVPDMDDRYVRALDWIRSNLG